MLRLSVLLTSLLCAVFSQEFKGQVDNVYTNVDMVNTPLTIGYNPPDLFFPAIFREANSTVTPSGSLSTTGFPGLGLISGQSFFFEKGKELHFRVEASYHSEGMLDGPSGDPSNGAFLFGAYWSSNLVAWLLTDYSEYAIIQSFGPLYAIPLGKREPDETATYTIIVDRSSRKIRFNKNNVNMLIAPGSCGIDNRFTFPVVEKSAEACQPNFEDQAFEEEARLIFLLGNFFGVTEAASPTPFCMDCEFDQCRDSLSHAFGCQCQHPLTTGPAYNATFYAQLNGIQVFDMQRTKRCRNDKSSSSTFRQWWQRPGLKDGDEENVDEPTEA